MILIGKDRLDDDKNKENNTPVWKRKRDKMVNSMSKKLKFTKLLKKKVTAEKNYLYLWNQLHNTKMKEFHSQF